MTEPTEEGAVETTRADFYIGRGEDAEWLGSIAQDGYPPDVFRAGQIQLPAGPVTEQAWRERVGGWLAGRDDATLPEQGWPWPWDDSSGTDFAYACDGGTVFGSHFGRGWFDARRHPGGHKDVAVVFPDMSAGLDVPLPTDAGEGTP